ncbi:MAG TPA: hypothetical protein VMT91_13165 [Anaerolineales bacterium]|nr:hypothetical protein [Anaerolineales bacterium]
MSKKSKRQVSRQVPRPAVPLVTRSVEFNPDYTTTKHELRRIGILAGSFILVLIVMAIFQNQLLALFVK